MLKKKIENCPNTLAVGGEEMEQLSTALQQGGRPVTKQQRTGQTPS